MNEPRSTALRPILSVILLAASLVATTRVAIASPTATGRCVADKTGAMSKYAGCVLKARRVFLLTGDNSRYDTVVAKCVASQTGSFGKAEANAGSGVCPVDGDAAAIALFADSCLAILGEGIAGNVIPSDLGACYGDLSTCQADRSSCDSDLSACVAALGSRTLQTGQTVCTNASGSTIACAGSGQDAELLAGVPPAYSDNGDGTITDTVTELTWEKLSNDGSIHDKDSTYTWTSGLDKIATLNSTAFASFTDWRMPNIRELETLIDFGRDFPTAFAGFNDACPSGCTVLTCNCTRSVSHWSSTTFEYDRACAWSVDFGVGTRSGLPKTSSFQVRAVRGGL